MAHKPSPDKNAMRAAEDAVRDIKNWIAVFADEHELSSNAKKELESKLNDLAKRIAAIECR